MSLLRPDPSAPHLDDLTPRAAIPGGAFEVHGSNLLTAPEMPLVHFGTLAATLDLIRPTRALVRVPEGAISSDLTFRTSHAHSNTLYANIGVPFAEDLHLIANPCTDPDGNLYAMVSGPRGERVPVSIYRIDPDLQMRPFARDLINISALAFGPDDHLYASSRSEGTVYRISTAGAITTYAEGMGIATGLAFDAGGNLFVGDRSGTIFKVAPDKSIFVFATLEPSVAAYHLCFAPDGALLVTAPTTSSNQPIHTIDPDGAVTTYFSGLGRPQGMAFDEHGNLYVAASLQSQRGIIRITPQKEASLYIAGNDLVGLCFLDDGCAALASKDTLFHVDLGLHGKPLL